VTRPVNRIRTSPRPACDVCGAVGTVVWRGLEDFLCGTPGTWDLRRCANPRCGLAWLDPMPLAEDIGQAYAAYYTHGRTAGHGTRSGRGIVRRVFRYLKHGHLAVRYGYGQGVGSWQKFLGLGLYIVPSLISSFRKGVRHVSRVPDGRLLDVGCGDGAYLEYMQSLGWDVEGVDFDPGAVAAARARGVPVKTGDLAQQDYGEDMFDVITLNHVIEHVPRPRDLLRECRRVLKPGGRLIVVTPNTDSWAHRHFGRSWRGLEPPRHLHIFTGPSLVALAAGIGLNVNVSFTVAGSRRTLLASRSIRETGRVATNGSYPFSWRLWALGLDLFEVGLNRLRPGTGQELVLILGAPE